MRAPVSDHRSRSASVLSCLIVCFGRSVSGVLREIRHAHRSRPYIYIYPAGDERLTGSTLHVLSTCNYVAEAATRLTMQLRQRHSLNQDKKYLRDVRDKLNMKTNTNELARIAPDLIPGKGGMDIVLHNLCSCWRSCSRQAALSRRQHDRRSG